MSDLAFLREFSSQPAKPVTTSLSSLSGSYQDAEPRPTSAPVATPQRENPVISSRLTSSTTERFSNPPASTAVEPTPTEESTVKEAPKESMEEPKTKSTSAQKFSYMYGVVGEVPKGYKAAAACYNCKHRESIADICMKYNFPVASNYGCESFEVIPPPEMYSNQVAEPEPAPEQSVNSNTATEVELSPLDQALVTYESVLSTLADQEIAGSVLNRVTERFSNRSDYADAYLKLKYRRAYEDKHGSLEGAFLTNEDSN